MQEDVEDNTKTEPLPDNSSQNDQNDDGENGQEKKQKQSSLQAAGSIGPAEEEQKLGGLDAYLQKEGKELEDQLGINLSSPLPKTSSGSLDIGIQRSQDIFAIRPQLNRLSSKDQLSALSIHSKSVMDQLKKQIS